MTLTSTGKKRCTDGRKGRHIHHHNPLSKGLACDPCRVRKVRCDGQQPCVSCVKSARFKKKEVVCCYYVAPLASGSAEDLHAQQSPRPAPSPVQIPTRAMNGACPLIPMKTDLSGTTPSDGPALSTVGEMLATAPITTVSPESSSRRPSPTPRAPPPSVAMVIAPTTSPPETLPCLPAPLIPPSITPYPTLPWTQAIQHPGAGNVMYVPVTIAPGMPPNQPGSMPWAFIVAPPDFQYILSPSSPHQNPPPTVPMGVSVMPVTSEPLPRSLDEQASNTAQSVSRSGAQPPLSLSTLDSNSVYQMYTRADVIDSAPNTTPLDQLQDLLHQCSASPMISEPGAMTPDATAYRDRESSLGSSSDSSTATMSQPATPGLLPFPSSARRPSFDSTLCAELSASSTSDIPVTPGTHEYQACWKWHLSSSLDDLEYFSLGPQGYDC